ncbi:TetR family transcriptional regulator C-terminal domain-containing protein [Kitasatospora aureofaciens]|uniref:TetR family transcriptional regulator n=1 Tax=Kitasatospora aureofaciens TaxID=1894 RepID=A0A1E7N2Y1_KITAU|nr:TetR/AcrR family transcriptional regulator [Kitasatospora aureofaciens]OEV35051.1 TetR family transcriptional regulator [Kitasatospora aureofaciens]
MPRRSAAEARDTRARILDRAVVIAARDGLEGVTIGRLADDLEMSKAGVYGHFGSKEALQLATFDAAVEQFRQLVPARVPRTATGIERLRHLCDAWIDYLEHGGIAEGGCFLTAAATEFDGRPGPVRDAVAQAAGRWLAYLEHLAAAAVETGDLPPDTDPAQIAFELNGIAMSANQAIQLQRDDAAPQRARRAMHRAAGGR